MIMQQITCESAARCQELAQIQQSLVMDAVFVTVFLVCVWITIKVMPAGLGQ